jgi:protease-4
LAFFWGHSIKVRMLFSRFFSRVALLALTLTPISHADQLRRIFDDVDDLFMPGPKVAGVEDAWSLYTNPAGIAYVDGAQFVGGYAYRVSTVDNGRHQATGILALSFFEGLSSSLALQLSLPQTQVGNDQGLIGGSMGMAYRFGRVISIGTRVTKQRQYQNTKSDPFLFGLGLQAFPTNWLSLGVSVSQVYDDTFAKSEIRAGVALRPFGERFTISAETLFWPKDSGNNSNYAVYPELAAHLDVGGFSLFASARTSDVTTGFSSPTLFAGLEFNFEHLGFGAIAKGRPSDNITMGGRFRLSSEAWPSVASKRDRIVSVSLNQDALAANESLSLKRLLFGPGAHPVEILARLDDWSKDESVSDVFLRFEPFDFGFPRAEELRNAITTLRKAGKKVTVHFNSANAESFFAASAADEIYMSPAGEIDLDDFRANLVYFHKLLENFGFTVQAISAGRYKSSPDKFTKSEPSPEELEVRNSILDQNFALFTSALSTLTKKDAATVHQAIDLGVVSAAEAKELGLVHGLAYLDEVPMKPSFASTLKHTRWGDTQLIAVIPIKGRIVPGSATPGLLNPFGSKSGAQDIISLIEQASLDPQTSAIVLRIDSPGGEALASNLIHRAVMQAKKHKPVVASMGDVAASGGYYVASAANTVFAQSTTLTGSIGVFSLIPSAGEIANKYGITYFEIKRGENPGPTWLRGLTAKESARWQHRVDADYDLFKKTVADARGLTKEAMEKAADGRTWTGSDALKLGLVDHLGGFSDAVAQARRLAGIADSEPTELSLLGVAAPALISIPPVVSTLAELSDSHSWLNGSTMALSTFTFKESL